MMDPKGVGDDPRAAPRIHGRHSACLYARIVGFRFSGGAA
jgi:hypothetical protein